MAFFVDTADLQAARAAQEFGWISGLTTNPLLLAKIALPPEETLRGLAALHFPKFFYQLTAPDSESQKREADLALEIIGTVLVLKITPTAAGLASVKCFSSRFPCCVTAVYSAVQAAAAAEAGAAYVAVYVNRASSSGLDGIKLVGEVAGVLAGSNCKVLAASIKSAGEASAALDAGADDLTIGPQWLTPILEHPLSAKAVAEFRSEGKGLGSSLG